MRDLLEEHVAAVYRFSLRLTGDCHRAEDLTQETFLRACRQRDQLRQPRAARAWLFRIVVNLWRDHKRREKRPAARASPLVGDVSAAAAAVEHTLAERETLARALASMNSLPPRQRSVLYLRAVENLTAREIADVLGTTADNVKVQLCLARKKMRQLLRDDLEHPP